MACKKNTNNGDSPYDLVIPTGFPAIEIPEGNELTVSRVALGKELFFDPILSRDSSVSCGSCHFADKAFSDVVALSKGVEGRLGGRNSPTLANVGYHPYFFKDGGIPTLELQVLAPIDDHAEFDTDVPTLIDRLAKRPHYVEQARKAYGRDMDAFVLTRSISAFERTLVSGNSAYDRYTQGNETALNAEEKRGLDLFTSNRTNCTGCHSGFLLSDFSFKNNGLYASYADTGRMRITLNELDRAKFKVASLRNIEVTGPYMHDGSLSTLEEVVEHYNSGGQPHSNKSELIKPLALNEQEKSDLVSFLKSLTDEEFISNKEFTP